MKDDEKLEVLSAVDNRIECLNNIIEALEKDIDNLARMFGIPNSYYIAIDTYLKDDDYAKALDLVNLVFESDVSLLEILKFRGYIKLICPDKFDELFLKYEQLLDERYEKTWHGDQ